jgi:hypothetical protein
VPLRICGALGASLNRFRVCLFLSFRVLLSMAGRVPCQPRDPAPPSRHGSRSRATGRHIRAGTCPHLRGDYHSLLDSKAAHWQGRGDAWHEHAIVLCAYTVGDTMAHYVVQLAGGR